MLRKGSQHIRGCGFFGQNIAYFWKLVARVNGDEGWGRWTKAPRDSQRPNHNIAQPNVNFLFVLKYGIIEVPFFWGGGIPMSPWKFYQLFMTTKKLKDPSLQYG